MKRRRNGEGFIRLKPGRKSLWEVRVSVVQDDGSKKQRTFYAQSYEQAQVKLAEVRIANSQGRVRPQSSPKLELCITEWVTIKLPNSGLKASTVENYTHVFNGTLKRDPLLSKKIDKIRPVDIEQFLGRLSASGLGSSTKRIALSILKQTLDVALKNGLLFTNPCGEVSRPRQDKSVTSKWLAVDEVSRILEELGESVYLPPALMMAISGMRRGEALALTWADIDFQRERVFVRATLNRIQGSLDVTAPKTSNSRRTLHMSLEMKNLLLHVKAMRQSNASSFIFVGESGNPIEPRNLLRGFKAAAKRAGLPNATLHSLRHAAASQMLNSGVPLFTVSKTLGHSSVSVTGDIYGHLEDHAQKSALKSLSGQFLTSVMAQSGGTVHDIRAGMLALSGWLDSRPLDPQSSALPSCAIARCKQDTTACNHNGKSESDTDDYQI
jgi:integrase